MSFLQEYTLLGELGQGGFAKVYKVRHNELGYIRAIRVLNEPVTDAQSRTYQKFLRECKVLLRLGNGTHPNIVHIYQPRLLENHALVEMDFVDGKDLNHYLANNGYFVPTDEVLRMAKEISSALAYCHVDIYRFCMDRTEDQLQDDPNDGSKVLIDEATRQRLINKYKVIHNDIHSGNIIRREDGSFVLLDFGLAITGADDVRNSSRHENGAIEYKAPEKWEDDTVLTEQSDIYSFGIVMYEYLAGRVPFPFDVHDSNRARSVFALWEAHKSQTPPPIFDIRKAYFEEKYPGKTYEKDYPDWIEETIMKCLEKDPKKRFKSGKELNKCICQHFDEQNVAALRSSNQSLAEENELLKARLKQVEEEAKERAAKLAKEKLDERRLRENHPVSTNVQQDPIDLRQHIGINDKFLFVNELFGGNMEKYNQSIDTLNDMKTLDRATYYLAVQQFGLRWESSNPAYQKLLELVKTSFKTVHEVKLRLPEGMYVGQVSYGKPHGNGIIFFNHDNLFNSVSYEGDWDNGQRSGNGVMIWKNGNRYEGNFINGIMNGHGTYYYGSGDRYEGEWKDHKKHGQGTYYYANGDIDSGNYTDGERDGKFTRITKDGRKLKARYIKGKMVIGWHSSLF